MNLQKPLNITFNISQPSDELYFSLISVEFSAIEIKIITQTTGFHVTQLRFIFYQVF